MSKEYTIARIYKNGENFEILVKPDAAFDYREGKITSVSEVLVSDVIYKDANKGLKSSEDSLNKNFGTVDTKNIASSILKKGNLQLNSRQRKQIVDEMKRRIITFISRQCFNPKTKFPHPVNRIEQALQQIHYSIDPLKTVEEQSEEIIKLLRPILPISTEKLQVELKIPRNYASKVYGTIKGYGRIKREEWKSDGSYYAIMEMSAGTYKILLEKIGSATKGTLEAKTI